MNLFLAYNVHQLGSTPGDDRVRCILSGFFQGKVQRTYRRTRRLIIHVRLSVTPIYPSLQVVDEVILVSTLFDQDYQAIYGNTSTSLRTLELEEDFRSNIKSRRVMDKITI